MLQPINYSLNVKTPFEAAVEGYKVGLAGQEAQAQRQLLEAQRAKALADAEKLRNEQQRAEKYQAKLAEIMAKSRPSAQDFRDLNAVAPETELARVKQGWDMLGAEEKKDRIKIGLQTLVALNGGKLEDATNTLQRFADSSRNFGNEQDAKDTEATIALMKTNPDKALLIVAPLFADLAEVKDEFDRAFKTAEEYVLIPGEGVVLKSDIARAAAEARAIGSNTITLPVAIPTQAIADLKLRGDKAVFDAAYGAGAADRVLGVKK